MVKEWWQDLVSQSSYSSDAGEQGQKKKKKSKKTKKNIQPIDTKSLEWSPTSTTSRCNEDEETDHAIKLSDRMIRTPKSKKLHEGDSFCDGAAAKGVGRKNVGD